MAKRGEFMRGRGGGAGGGAGEVEKDEEGGCCGGEMKNLSSLYIAK